MYEPHSLFEPPKNLDTPIWRYLDLAKFMSMLESNALHFARSDMLGDKFEGSFSKATIDQRVAAYGEAYSKIYPFLSVVRKNYRMALHVSCWNISEHESAAMWGLYQQGGRGVAVKSSFSRLTKSLRTESQVLIGKVRYIDYDKDLMPEGNLYAPFLYKRKSFEHEHELRAIVDDLGKLFIDKDGEQKINTKYIGSPTQVIAVDLPELIEAVYVAPASPTWFFELVQSIVGRYGYTFPVYQSDFDKDALY